MNIVEFKNSINDEEIQKCLNDVSKICQYIGDNVATGYIESSIDSINYDDYGNFEFHSLNQNSTLTTDSLGALLSGSVVIKQKQVDSVSGTEDNHIISWKKDGSQYTYISFSSPEVTDYAYSRIKACYPDYLDVNASSILSSLSIPIEMIKEIQHKDVGYSEVTASELANFDDNIEILDVIIK